jgi:NTP pyrophosphatase (non-canonical NTP hydrolase)
MQNSTAVRLEERGTTGDLATLRTFPRNQRQAMIMAWVETAFGHKEATSHPQRGLRLLEEALETFQACDGHAEIAHKLVANVFSRPPGILGQELGGVAVAVLALAAASGLSAEEEECREVHRVLSRPVDEFSRCNACKIKISEAACTLPRNACCNVSMHGDTPRRAAPTLVGG